MYIFGRHYLLCNNCNWEFVGFALPGTVSTGTRRRNRKKTGEDNKNQTNGLETIENLTNGVDPTEKDESIEEIMEQETFEEEPEPTKPVRVKVKKRVRTRQNK